MQTNLKSDGFCRYNQAGAWFEYIFQDGQYDNKYMIGEVGINAAGGVPGSYVGPSVIDIDSFLSGRDEILSRCNPPVPSLEELNAPKLVSQDSNISQRNQRVNKKETFENIQPDLSMLISKDTREKKSAIDLSSIDYNRWDYNIPVEPQDLRFVIEGFSAQRGGMDTQNYAKSAWKPSVDRGSAINGDPRMCNTTLRPGFACGEYCNSVSGYSGWNGDAKAVLPGKPQENYPFTGITSQNIKDVGATRCGEQQFYGPTYTEGSCGPNAPQRVMKNQDSMAYAPMYSEYGNVNK